MQDRAFPHGRLDDLRHPGVGGRVDERTDVRCRLRAVSDPQRPGPGGQRLDQCWRDARGAVDPAGGGAGLPGQPERAPGDQLGGNVRLRVVQDDGGVRSAQLQLDAGHALPRDRRDLPADLGGPREADGLDARVGDDGGADRGAPADQDVEYARRQSG
nr:hypothetical protein [Micromonospora olivasterospora]